MNSPLSTKKQTIVVNSIDSLVGVGLTWEEQRQVLDRLRAGERIIRDFPVFNFVGSIYLPIL